jgi:hypothetical protein
MRTDLPLVSESTEQNASLQGEVKLLLELLPKYVTHVEKHPHTLLVKFFGLYRVIPDNGSKARNPV